MRKKLLIAFVLVLSITLIAGFSLALARDIIQVDSQGTTQKIDYNAERAVDDSPVIEHVLKQHY